MTEERNVTISLNSKVLTVAALGAGIFVGASAVYVLTRIHEHSNLAKLVSNLHSTIKEVKEDLANIENELSVLHGPTPLPDEKPIRKRHRKAVSFSSTTSSYRTAEVNHDVDSDAGSYRTAPNYDTDYFSPDEEDDEFFDVTHSDDDGELLNDSNRIPDDVPIFSNLLRNVDFLIDGSPDSQIEAYELLLDKGSQYENNAEILWRKAKAARNLALIEEKGGYANKRKELLDKGCNYAAKALQINDASADVHKWYAILSCSRGEFMSTRERIESGQIFKKHIDIALQISPNDSSLHHLLGRFCFEVSLLTWVERKVASVLFGDVLVSSFDEALEHFLLAEELKPAAWKENSLYIAKCYLKKQEVAEARQWLKKALDTPVVTVDDEIVDKEIDELMKAYRLEP